MEPIIIEIPKYLRRVKLSESRLPKYYELGKNIPKAKKYKDTKKYEWKANPLQPGRIFLYNKETGERIISNPRAMGTPKYIVINGQKIYNAEMPPHVRNKVLSAIKESFAPYINKLPVLDEYPIAMELEVHDTIREANSNSPWDMDNRAWPYIKAFQDCLTGNRDKTGIKRNKQIIVDDSVIFVTQPPVPKFIPVDNEEDRKLVFKIKKETDERILKHKGFIEEHRKIKDNKGNGK